MHFVSTFFLLFFLVVFVVSLLLRKQPTVRSIWLLAASLVFYATWSADLLWILIAVCVITYAFGRLLSSFRLRRYKKAVLIIGLVLLVGVLGVFKYYEFFRSSSIELLSMFGINAELPLVRLLTPIGLSFFVFRSISYLVDCYTRRVAERYSLLDVSLYISFFPQVLSGPIMRANQFVTQIREKVSERAIDWESALTSIVAGLFKKVVIASYLQSAIVDDFFAVPANSTGLVAILAIVAYSFQIYMDFSGYTDIAIGLSQLLGVRSPQNFDHPYTAKSPVEFWRRWHITLSSWLKDYLYIPLGGNRKGVARKYINLIITMLLGGLWHGAGWQFVVWGGLHGVGLVISHALEGVAVRLKRPMDGVFKAFFAFSGWLTTFVFVSFIWVFFRADSLENAIGVFRTLFAGGIPKHGVEVYVLIVIAACLILQFVGGWFRQKYELLLRIFPFVFKLALISATAIVLLKLGPEIVPPFIYFKF